jgi:arginine deiminase
MAKKITIKSLQNDIRESDIIIQDLFDSRTRIVKLNKKLTKRNKSLEKNNSFVDEVKNDYILSNKHMRDMEKIRVEMEYEKNKISNGIIGIIIETASQVLPSLLINLLNQNKNEDGK